MTRSKNKWVVESDEFGGDILRWEDPDGNMFTAQLTGDEEPDYDAIHKAYSMLVKMVEIHCD